MKFLYNKTSQIPQKSILATAQRLKKYTAELRDITHADVYEKDESSILVPHDSSHLHAVEQVLEAKFEKRLKYVLVIGIGGSNLGTKAIYDGLYGYFDVVLGDAFPKMLFMDTTNPSLADAIGDVLDAKVSHRKEILINIVSKSGSTTETVANAEFVLSELQKKHKKILQRVVITTDKGSVLDGIAQEKGIHTLHLPDKVGGRFAVFTAVGLFPLAAVGINIRELLAGAKGMRDFCLDEDPKKNPAALSAATLYELSKKKKIVNDNFIFNAELESLGKWYRQLMAESIGKNGKGMIPTVSIGSTDLHSMAQLYFDGPKSVCTTFIHADSTIEYPKVSQDRVFESVAPALTGKTFVDIIRAIRIGVKKTYLKQKLPYTEVILNNVSEKSLGEFMQFKMMEIMFLGKLMRINPFDQPSVELYKAETKKLLQK